MSALRKIVSISCFQINPTIAAGIVAIISRRISFQSPLSMVNIFPQNIAIKAMSVPACKMMSKLKRPETRSPSSSSASTKCPELDTGTNSVIPCINPSSIASRKPIFLILKVFIV